MITVADHELDVVKWYTRSRKFPIFVGKTANGGRLWGGPYTITQIMVGAGVFLALISPPWLWTRIFNNPVANATIFLIALPGSVFLTGRIPIGSRNPLTLAAGLLGSWFRPANGTINGLPVRVPPRRSVGGRSSLILTGGAADSHRTPEAPVVDVEPEHRPGPALTSIQQLLAAPIQGGGCR